MVVVGLDCAGLHGKGLWRVASRLSSGVLDDLGHTCVCWSISRGLQLHSSWQTQQPAQLVLCVEMLCCV